MPKPVPAEVLDRLRVQERFDCWNRGELDLMLEPYAEDAVFDTSAVFTDARPARGRESIVRYWKELQETWGGGLHVDPIVGSMVLSHASSSCWKASVDRSTTAMLSCDMA